MLNYLSTILWKCMGEWRYSSTILDLFTRCRWVVSFTLLPLYPRRKNSLHPLDMRLGGPQSRSGRCGKGKKSWPFRNRTRTVQPVAHRCTDWAIPAPDRERRGMNTNFPFVDPSFCICHWRTELRCVCGALSMCGSCPVRLAHTKRLIPSCIFTFNLFG
jgi:hypothetical protein